MLYIVLSIFAVICLYPVFFTLTSSLKNNTEIFTEPFSLPRTPQWENYVRAWTIGKMGVYFKNSIILTAATLFVSAIIGSMASYILAKYTFKGKSFVYILFLAGMMIPIQTVIIPLAFTFGKLGIVDNLPVLVLLYSAFCLSMTVFIVTGYMKGLPDELEEAAVMDGANLLQQIWYVELPAIKDIIVIQFILQAGNIMSIGFEKAYALQTDMNLPASEILSTYVYRIGLLNGDYGYSTAVGLFNSVINVILLIFVNFVVKKINDGEGL